MKRLAHHIQSLNIHQWLIFIAATIVVFARFRLLEVPLERDEGEFAYQAQLLFKGYLPFELTYNLKLPGTTFMYAFFFLIFGQSVYSVHLGLLIINLVSSFLIYKTIEKILSKYAGWIAGLTYLYLSFSNTMLGFAAHATHFVVFFFILGLYFYMKWNKDISKTKSFIIGALIGLSFLIKQHAVFFILLFGFLFLIQQVFNKKNVSTLIFYSIGVFTPYLFLVTIYILNGSFDQFWFWTFTYAKDYASALSIEEGGYVFRMLFARVTYGYRFFWLISFIGFILLFIKESDANKKLLYVLLAIFSFLSITPGFLFSPHYFILLLPMTSIFVAGFFNYFYKYKTWSFYVFYLFIIIAIYQNRNYYFFSSPKQVCIDAYGKLPFTVSEEIGELIKKHTNEGDKVLILGAEPQILFHADRLPATGYLYIYGALEVHENALIMQQQIINEAEKSDPRIVVVFPINYWSPRWNSNLALANWSNQFAENYKPVVFYDVIEGKENIVIKKDDDLKNYNVKSNRYIGVYKKNEN